jgi:DNA-binding CsgD family transcriptional regulator
MEDLSSRDGTRLTSRQREIVKLIALDLTSKEIGERLEIAQKTVEFHRDVLKRRLDVRGTAGIVRYAIRHGIIDP